MTHKTTSIPSATSFIRHISLSIWPSFFKRKNTEQAHFYPQFVSSASVFSLPDQSELLAHEEEISPLVEAEVYVIYGRTNDAKKALDSGVKSGVITAEEAAQFWSNQNNVVQARFRRTEPAAA